MGNVRMPITFYSEPGLLGDQENSSDDELPPLGECQSLSIVAHSIRNYTDRQVVVCEEEDCNNPTVTIGAATANGPTENGNLRATRSFSTKASG